MDIIGSQMTLTSRLDLFPHASSCIRFSRPRSATLLFRSEKKESIECLRPKSAEFPNWNLCHNFLYQSSSSCNESKDEPSLLSHFTDSSSKLLIHLLKESDQNVVSSREISLENNVKKFVNFSSDCQNNISNDLILKNNYTTEWKKENPQTLIVGLKNKRDLEETSSRHLESDPSKTSSKFSLEERNPCRTYLEGRTKFHDISAQNKFFKNLQEGERRSGKTLFSNEEKFTTLKEVASLKQKIPKIDMCENENEDEVLKIEPCNEGLQNEKDMLLNQKQKNGKYSNNEDRSKSENNLENDLENQIFNFAQQGVYVANILTSRTKNSEKCDLTDDSFNTASSESLHVRDEGLETASKFVRPGGSDSTYDEIIQLLQTLEDENNENRIQENTVNVEENSPCAEEISKNTTGDLNDVFAYLEEVEKDEPLCPKTGKTHCIFPSLEKLLNKTSVELAHEVLSLEIQIEDQKKGIKLLKDTITEMKEEKKVAESEHQEILHKTSSDAEILVKRHQKFIKQLLNEKKNLSEMVSKLVHDLKASEVKYKMNIKAMEEKHLIEVKKAKNIQAVADKIKREKWMEMKTQKIKEMTVKGLEPELSRMAAQQQQELTELRNLHRAEIEALELKAARRTSELMDQLRTELTKEKESAITDKVNSLRASMERDFEEERNKFHQNCQALKQRIRKLEEKLSNQEAEFHSSLTEAKKEMEKEKQKLVRFQQENMDEIKRLHSIELNKLRETLETDKNICLKNQEKQLTAKFSDKETELHEQYRRERDREIEMVIEKFEKEQAKIQVELEIAGENKLKRMKDKLEVEMKELEANEADLKAKLSLAKLAVAEKEECITQLNSQIRQIQTEIGFLRKSCEEMTFERSRLKETIRSEFEKSINDLSMENKNLQKEIFDLKEAHLKELGKKDQLHLKVKNEMHKEMTNVYNRIKAAISKKDKIIQALQEENKAANERYRQLELTLDRQRRNLLLD